MASKISEFDLDLAFAEAVRQSDVFQTWLVGRTKFASLVPDLRLLDKEQGQRKAKHWWRHWWCRVPELERDSETDVFIVFENIGGRRIALHVENKPPHGKFTFQQAESYAPRARHMMGKAQFMGYHDFTTVIVAPNAFLTSNEAGAAQFDVRLAYEDVGRYVPLFADAVRSAG